MIALIAIATGTSAFASTTTETNSVKVMDHFNASYKDVKNVAWTFNGTYERASFTLGQQKLEVYYNTDGDLIGTTKNFNFDKLPQAAIETITTKYTFPKYELRDCVEFVNAYDEKCYYVSFTKKKQTIVVKIDQKGEVSRVS